MTSLPSSDPSETMAPPDCRTLLEAHVPWTMATFNNLGFNLRLSDIQAAVGVAQMAKLDRLLAERRRLGRRYSELLAAVNSIARPTPAIPKVMPTSPTSFGF